MKRQYNDSMGQSRSSFNPKEEADESEDYQHNKKVMRGHAEDSRFDEGSTDKTVKIVRPITKPKTYPAKYDIKPWGLTDAKNKKSKVSTTYQAAKIGGK